MADQKLSVDVKAFVAAQKLSGMHAVSVPSSVFAFAGMRSRFPPSEAVPNNQVTIPDVKGDITG